MSHRLTISQFADAAGCDRKQVYRAIERGILVRDADGLLDSALARTDWRKPDRRTLAKRDTVPRDSEKASRGSRRDNAPPLYTDSLARKEHAQAQLRELELATKSGQLIDRDLVGRVLFDRGRQIRDAWMNWPIRVAPLIAADLGIDAERLRAALDEAVNTHLASLGAPNADLQ